VWVLDAESSSPFFWGVLFLNVFLIFETRVPLLNLVVGVRAGLSFRIISVSH
jgi:hypothetical protein